MIKNSRNLKMKVDTMRWIDRNIGVPLCFFISILIKIKRLLSRALTPTKPRKILFIELSEMGSMVLAYSLLKKTKELFPDAELYFLTFEKNRYAIDILNIIPQENVKTIKNRSFLLFLNSTFKAVRQFRRTKISTVLDMEFFSRFTSIISYLCGAKERVGYSRYFSEGLYRGNILTHKVIYNPHIHTSFNLLNLIYSLESDGDEIPAPKRPLANGDLVLPQREISEEAEKHIRKKLKEKNENITSAEKIILLNPNASDIIPLRKWPIQNYELLAQRLLELEGIFIVITGTEDERQTGDIICHNLQSKKCLNFSGETSFSELLDLYSVSDMLITNDSGPAHFSTMTDIETFVLFGPETPHLYGPLGNKNTVFYADFSCSPCVSVFNQRRSPCSDNRCLKAITVEEVFLAAQQKILRHESVTII